MSSLDLAAVARAVKLIEYRTGLDLTAQFRHELPAFLDRLAGGDLNAFVRRLQTSSESSLEWQSVINTFTIGETYFMRDGEHFRILRQKILPALTMERRQAPPLELTVWCMGCATGEEPYSVAMTLFEFLPDLTSWRLNIIATDINGKALDAARNGVYRRWSFRHTPDYLEKRYFEPTEHGLQLSRPIRQMVTFQRASLLEVPPVTSCDIIFCRNVMLYLRRDLLEGVEDMMYRVLRPGGWLLLGQAEALRYERDRWLMHVFPGVPIYQKPPLRSTGTLSRVRYETLEPLLTTLPVTGSLTDDYGQAVAALRADDAKQAAQILSGLVSRQPHHAPTHILLAYLFANQKALPEAESHLNAALRIDALQADAFYVKALLALEKDDEGLARTHIKAALYCNRQHVLALDAFATMQLKAGSWSDAYRIWNNARRVLAEMPPDAYVSDLSELTAHSFDDVLKQRLKGGT